VSVNGFGANIIAEIVSSTYGNLANRIDVQMLHFFSDKEIRNVLANKKLSSSFADKIYQLSNGYPALVSAMVCAIEENELSIEEDTDCADWFAHWYETFYFANYLVPALKMFKATLNRKSESAIDDAIQKLIKQIRITIVGEESMLRSLLQSEEQNDVDSIDGIAQSTIDQISQSLAMIDMLNVYETGIIFPEYVCKQNGIRGTTLPIIRQYWQHNPAQNIYEKLQKLMVLDS